MVGDRTFTYLLTYLLTYPFVVGFWFGLVGLDWVALGWVGLDWVGFFSLRSGISFYESEIFDVSLCITVDI